MPFVASWFSTTTTQESRWPVPVDSRIDQFTVTSHDPPLLHVRPRAPAETGS
jgi:hypothetical protein